VGCRLCCDAVYHMYYLKANPTPPQQPPHHTTQGFSSFTMPLPERFHALPAAAGVESVQVTLVDCPGHASLIRTIIGGAHIIDVVVLVVDVTRGIQAQTVECVVIAEVTTKSLVIVLNKVSVWWCVPCIFQSPALLTPDRGGVGRSRDRHKQPVENRSIPTSPPAHCTHPPPPPNTHTRTQTTNHNTLTPTPKQVDLIPEPERAQRVAAQQEAIRRQLRGSPFADAPMVAAAAAVGGEKVAAATGGGAKAAAAGEAGGPPLGMEELVATLRRTMPYPARRAEGPLYMAVDHCFPIKGQGTVLTGTVLGGRVVVGDTVELPVLGERRKVKSLQVFHRSVGAAGQGDRVGLCVTNLDAKLIERGVLCAPGSIGRVERALAVVRRVRAFRGEVLTGQRVHVSVGHVTVMARATFFGARELWRRLKQQQGQEGGGEQEAGGGSLGVPAVGFDWAEEFEYQGGLMGREAEALAAWGEGEEGREGAAGVAGRAGADGEGKGGGFGKGPRFLPQFVLLEFESPVLCPLRSLVIGSRLDGEFGAVGGGGGRREAAGAGACGGGGGGGGGGKPCRLAFYGTLLASLRGEDLRRVRIYKRKQREGTVHRLGEAVASVAADAAGDGAGVVRYKEATGQGLFKKETDLRPFVGMRVETRDGQLGRIEAGFGKGGKFRVRFDGAGAVGVKPGDRLYLRFQRFLHDPEKRMVQSATPLPPLGGKAPAAAAVTVAVAAEGEAGPAAPGGGGHSSSSSSSTGGNEEGEEGAGLGEVVDGVDLSALETEAAALSLDPPHYHNQHQHPYPHQPPLHQQQHQPHPVQLQSMPSSGASGPTSSLHPASGTPPTAVPAPPGSGGGLEARYGVVDAVREGDLVIVKGFFSMEEDVRQYVGMRVVLTDGGTGLGGAEGCVVGPFGKGGKAKVQFASSFAGEVGTPLTLYVERA
jgi:selenocysteine-specific elongation factor